MTSVSSYSTISVALSGLKQADQALVAAVEAVGSGSLDADTMAQAAAILKGAEMQARTSAVALQAGLDQQRRFVDILA